MVDPGGQVYFDPVPIDNNRVTESRYFEGVTAVPQSSLEQPPNYFFSGTMPPGFHADRIGTNVDNDLPNSIVWNQVKIVPDPSSVSVVEIPPINTSGTLTLRATSVDNNIYGQLIVLSTVPGDVQQYNKNDGLWQYSTSTAELTVYVGIAGDQSRAIVDRNHKYYLNIIHWYRGAQLGTMPSECSFFFSGEFTQSD